MCIGKGQRRWDSRVPRSGKGNKDGLATSMTNREKLPDSNFTPKMRLDAYIINKYEMAVATLPALLSTLTDSLKSTADAIPDASYLTPLTDGISLLDTKNELLLSYLQNLAFLILLKLRNDPNSRHVHTDANGTEDGSDAVQVEVVKKLVELRVYLEKGVRPLENRLKYQIDKVIRAAENDARNDAQKVNGASKPAKTKNRPSNGDVSGGDESEDNVEDDDDEPPRLDDLAYRPNPAALMRLSEPTNSRTGITKSSNNVYRPPRITPTSLPTTSSSNETARRTKSSATLSEFVSTELSTAPIPEPSIGSTILDRGRRYRGEKERETEKERRAYEEGNYVRLPKEGKKEKGKRRAGEGYGGEEWRGLGEGAERIVGLTKGRKESRLERSRKRERDGGREDGREDRKEDMRGDKRRRVLGGRERKRKGR